MSAELGVRLREERRKTGLNQERFADLGGVKRNSQAEYESGKTPPNSDYLERLAAAGVDVGFVVTGQRAGDSLALDEAELLDLYRAIPGACRGALLILAGYLKNGTPPAAAHTFIQVQEPGTIHAASTGYRTS
jgi:transcriptional regulator with XRE-family HTH domain